MSNIQSPSLQINSLVPESAVDGQGLRFVLFVQGCPHRCVGCHNPQTHPFEGGFPLSVDDALTQILENPLLRGVTFSGGEPFCQAEALAELAGRVRTHGLEVMTYSGWTLAQLEEKAKTEPDVADLLALTDVLVDGLYVESLRDLTLDFRGSSNQKIIEMKR